MKKKRQTAKAPSAAAMEAVRAALLSVMPNLKAKDIKPKSRVVSELGVDSLKIAELSVALEGEVDRPVFLGDLIASVPNPGALTVAEVAAWLDAEVLS